MKEETVEDSKSVEIFPCYFREVKLVNIFS